MKEKVNTCNTDALQTPKTTVQKLDSLYGFQPVAASGFVAEKLTLQLGPEFPADFPGLLLEQREKSE